MTIQSDEHKFFCSLYIYKPWASQVALVVKNLSINAGGRGSIPGLGRSLEKDMITHSSILAWRSPWTEEPGRLQYMGLHRVGHSWATKTFTFTLYTHTHTHTYMCIHYIYLFICKDVYNIYVIQITQRFSCLWCFLLKISCNVSSFHVVYCGKSQVLPLVFQKPTFPHWSIWENK